LVLGENFLLHWPGIWSRAKFPTPQAEWDWLIKANAEMLKTEKLKPFQYFSISAFQL
jgi:hypothetical protein